MKIDPAKMWMQMPRQFSAPRSVARVGTLARAQTALHFLSSATIGANALSSQPASPMLWRQPAAAISVACGST